MTEEVRISIIGTGRMGYYHARLLARLGYLDSIVDSDTSLAKSIGQQFNRPWFTDLESMIDERSPNGVILAVPTKDHHEVSLEIVKKIPSLKAMLIEKPFTSTVEEAISLKSKLTDIKVVVGHIEVFNPVIRRIQEILDQGLIGLLRSILFQRRGAVAEDQIESIGDCYEDVGLHDFDVASRILPKGNYRLFSSAVKVNGLDNSSAIILSPENGEFYTTFIMSREYSGKMRTIDIEGTKATLVANLLTQMLELRSLEIARGEKDSTIRIPFSTGEQMKVYGEPLLQEIFHFVNCIQNNETNPLVSIDDAINALRFVEAARESIKTENVTNLQLL